jgi:hypothetical protein
MTTNFGKRGLRGAPTTGRPHSAPGPLRPPPRRMRSSVVIIGAVGALALSIAAASEWRQDHCRQRPPGDPNPRPAWCDMHGGGHSHSHGAGFFSGGGVGHASFGGFGAHGSGHGGG